MNFLKSHTKAVSLVAGATVTIAGLFLLFKNSTKGSADEYEDDEDLDMAVPILSQADRETIERSLKVEYTGNALTITTISKILVSSIKLAGARFHKMTKIARKQRRAVMDDFEEYARIICKHADLVEELINKTQDEILVALGIPESAWEESNKLYLTQGRQDLMTLHLSLPHHLKMNMKPTKTITKEEFIEALKFQIELLAKEGKEIKEKLGTINDPEKISEVVQNKMNDRLFEELGIEEEETLTAMREHKDDPQIQQLVMEFQRLSMELDNEPTEENYF